MHWSLILSLCGSALLPTAIAFETPIKSNYNASDIVPGTFIVEFADDHDTNSFVQSFSLPANMDIRMNLDYELFKGVSFRLESDGSDVDTVTEQISSMRSVKRVWPVRKMSIPDDKIIWKGTGRDAAAAGVAGLQATNTNNTFSPLLMTQVDHLHAEGITGEGIKIAVIDTGIDYTHPALGGCFGADCLVSYGTDLVGDDYTGTNTPQPDPDPLDCQGHGTHVAGIIAARDTQYGILGAAPDVKLGAYKISGCDGGFGEDVLIAAFNQAYEDGSDIITASLGGPSGWTEDPLSVVVQRIVEAGVPCTIAAGNDGGAGVLYGTPANGKGVAAVASVDNIERPLLLLNASYTTRNSSSLPFGWIAGEPANWGNISRPLWVNPNRSSVPWEDCAPFPEDTPDLSNYVVLIWTAGGGDCFLGTKVENAAAYGARLIMFYNTGPDVFAIGGFPNDLDGVGMVASEVGEEWISLLSRNISVSVNIVDPESAVTYLSSANNTESGGFVSTYSSWGPTLEMDFKPQFAAPGGLILSTFPMALGGYAVISGTSMATPHMAAIYALVGQVRGTLDPATIENLLSATANPNLFHDGRESYPYLAPAAQQGAGLVQAYDAAHATTILGVSSISFNDTDHLTSGNFTIRNLGTDEVTYSLSNVGAASVYPLRDDLPPQPFPWNELTPEGASLSFSSDKITIPAGGEATVTVDATPPALNETRLPVYSGYIALNATNGESLSLPYMGLAGSLHNTSALNKNNWYFNDLFNYTPIVANQTFTVPAVIPTDWSYNHPIFFYSFTLAGGSPLFRLDAVRLDAPGNSTQVLNVYTELWSFAAGFVNMFNGYLADGSFAPEGRYKLVVTALRIFGDAGKEEDYDVIETVPFNLRYTE